MSDKPTFREFKGIKQDVVKTDDGRYFLVKNHDTIRRILFVFSLLINITPVLLTMIRPALPRNLVFEIVLTALLLIPLIQRLQYRLSRFKEITDDTEDYRGFESWFSDRREKASRIKHRVWVLVLVFIIIFVVANSFSAFYLRSMFEDRARFASIELRIGGEEETLSVTEEGDSSTIRLPETVPVHIQAMTACTPQRLQVILDGQTIVHYDYAYRYERPSWFWQRDYFVQEYDTVVWDIRDGSVLELTCGDLHRSWVFDLTEEE